MTVTATFSACFQRFQQHALATTAACAVFWTTGLCIGFLGPTLLDLLCRLGPPTQLNATTLLFLAQSASMVGANLLASPLLRYASLWTLLLCAVAVALCLLILVPFCPSFICLLLLLSVMGFSMGLMETLGTLGLIQLHHGEVAPFLHFGHFLYGLGALLNPIIVEPFLDPTCENATVNSMLNSSTKHSKVRAYHQPSRSASKHPDHLSTAFFILVVTQLPTVALLVVQRLTHKRQGQATTQTSDGSTARLETRHVPTLLVIALLGVCVAVADGLKGVMADYVSVYGELVLKGIPEVAELNATFWGFFTIGRLAATLASVYVDSRVLVLIDACGVCFSAVLQLLLPISQPTLFFTTAAIGLFLASSTPACLSLAERRIVSFLVLIASVGESALPVVFGNITTLATYAFPAAMLVAAALFISSIAAAVWIMQGQVPDQSEEIPVARLE